jgi:4-hydroxybenzoate polyprenyltransferase
MFAGAIMFAYGIKPYNIEVIKLILFTIITLYSGFFAALIWNDISDQDIDIIAHPNRPIPSGRISSKKFFAIALIFSALTFIFAVLISLWCLLLVGITAIFVTFHNKYLKKIIKTYAYSEIFTPFQWLTVPLIGFLAVWTALPKTGNINLSAPLLGYISIHSTHILPMLLLILFTYFADDAHDLAEGIVDKDGDRKHGVKTYATTFGERIAAKISLVMFFISGILGIILWLMTFLSLIFIILFILLWSYTLKYYYQLVKTTDDLPRKYIAKIAGKKGYDYFLFSYALIFLDVFLQVLNASYFHLTSPII